MEQRDRDKIDELLETLTENTNETQFKNILKHFEKEKLLNQWMINDIWNNEDPKRRFYEIVPKRGPNAFRSLEVAFNESGLTRLANLLNGVDQDDTSVINGQPPTIVDLPIDGNCIGRKNNINNNDENKTEMNKIPTETYNIRSKHKGLVVIINNYEFPFAGKSHTREGSEHDVERLENYWKKAGFKVKKKKDLTMVAFQFYIKELNDSLKDTDSLIIFIMSHGKADDKHPRSFNVEFPDNGYLSSEWILAQFDSVNCPNLGGKPKIIFFQTCRGSNVNFAIALDGDGPIPKANGIRQIPWQSDLMVVYSTSPGCISLRSPEGGAYFIQELCDVLESQSKSDLREVLDKVSQRLKERVIKEHSTFFQVMHIEKFGFDKRFPLNN